MLLEAVDNRSAVGVRRRFQSGQDTFLLVDVQACRLINRRADDGNLRRRKDLARIVVAELVVGVAFYVVQAACLDGFNLPVNRLQAKRFIVGGRGRENFLPTAFHFALNLPRGLRSLAVASYQRFEHKDMFNEIVSHNVLLFACQRAVTSFRSVP